MYSVPSMMTEPATQPCISFQLAPHFRASGHSSQMQTANCRQQSLRLQPRRGGSLLQTPVSC